MGRRVDRLQSDRADAQARFTMAGELTSAGAAHFESAEDTVKYEMKGPLRRRIAVTVVCPVLWTISAFFWWSVTDEYDRGSYWFWFCVTALLTIGALVFTWSNLRSRLREERAKAEARLENLEKERERNRVNAQISDQQFDESVRIAEGHDIAEAAALAPVKFVAKTALRIAIKGYPFDFGGGN